MENKIIDITGLGKYHKKLETDVLSKKQDNITDLETIRTGAAAGAVAEQNAKDYAKDYADGLATNYDAAGSAAAAQAAAEATAAADATSKANAAQAAAEATAAADAASKANAAQAAAEATASADATSKANAAQAAAEATAAADATSKANTAEKNAKDYAKDYADGLATNYDAAGSAAAAQAAAEKKATDLNTDMDVRVKKLEEIDHEKLASDASAAAVAAIVAGAESDFDTLKEVAEWIASDTQGSAALQATVSGHTTTIGEINKELDALDANKQDAISDLETIRSGAEAGATALQADDLGFADDDDINGIFSL